MSLCSECSQEWAHTEGCRYNPHNRPHQMRSEVFVCRECGKMFELDEDVCPHCGSWMSLDYVGEVLC